MRRVITLVLPAASARKDKETAFSGADRFPLLLI